MARHSGQTQRRQNLPQPEIDDQQPPRRRALHAADQRPRLLLQPVALEDADDRQDDIGDRDIAVLVEA
jgi:hypothetical protein